MQVGTPEEIYDRPRTPLRGRLRRLLERAAPTSREPLTGRRRWAACGPSDPAGRRAGSPATVAARRYLGAATRLSRRRPGRRIAALVPKGAPVPAPGDAVALDWDAPRCT
jgi:putative spermidine/putrescine transport system ATP-binding protein